MDLLGRVQERVDAQGHTLLMQRDVRQFVQGHHLWPELQQALCMLPKAEAESIMMTKFGPGTKREDKSVLVMNLVKLTDSEVASLAQALIERPVPAAAVPQPVAAPMYSGYPGYPWMSMGQMGQMAQMGQMGQMPYWPFMPGFGAKKKKKKKGKKKKKRKAIDSSSSSSSSEGTADEATGRSGLQGRESSRSRSRDRPASRSLCRSVTPAPEPTPDLGDAAGAEAEGVWATPAPAPATSARDHAVRLASLLSALPSRSRTSADLGAGPEPAEGSPERGLREWLRQLDGGRGALLQYFEALRDEFGADLEALAAAARLPEGQWGPGALGRIDPRLWNACGVKAMGHKLLLARGVNSLP